MRNFIPCLGHVRAKLYILFRTEMTKIIPCPAAHPRMGHIRKYPPGFFYDERYEIVCESYFSAGFCVNKQNNYSYPTLV